MIPNMKRTLIFSGLGQRLQCRPSRFVLPGHLSICISRQHNSQGISGSSSSSSSAIQNEAQYVEKQREYSIYANK